MCRLFGFRAVINSTVHNSLVAADNALCDQSIAHPDGWGVAYYIEEVPHLVKSVDTAQSDHLFHRVSGVVSSQTLIAHLRKATVGERTILNTHPFQYGRWTFAHNGTIRNFAENRNELLHLIAPVLRRFILGDTDSELLFFLILNQISTRVALCRHSVDIETVQESIFEAIESISRVVGPLVLEGKNLSEPNYCTFLITNGTTIAGFHGGKNLFYSTYKSKCEASATCPFFADECISPAKRGYVNHLLFSSEPIVGENVWLPMEFKQVIGVDSRMLICSSS